MGWRVNSSFFINYSFRAFSFSFSFAFAFDPGDASSYVDAFEFPLTALPLSLTFTPLPSPTYLERLVMIMTYKFRQLYFTRINDEFCMSPIV